MLRPMTRSSKYGHEEKWFVEGYVCFDNPMLWVGCWDAANVGT